MDKLIKRLLCELRKLRSSVNGPFLSPRKFKGLHADCKRNQRRDSPARSASIKVVEV